MTARRACALAFLLAAGCSRPAPAPAPVTAGSAPARAAAKAAVERLATATVGGDAGTLADLTHPAVVRMLGGRDKLIETVRAGTAEMGSKGFRFTGSSVGEPSEPVAGGSDLYVVVPFAFTMSAPDGRLEQNSFVVGVSSDRGATWTFANGDLDPKAVREVFPSLPAGLVLPERQQPKAVRD